MHESIHGYTRANISEWEFAQFLKLHGALNTYSSIGPANLWYDISGICVAMAYYSGPGGMTVAYWTRDNLVMPKKKG